MSGKPEFERQLRELGYEPQDQVDGRVVFPYTVPAGSFAGKNVLLGTKVPPDFPRTPPGGPHISPRLQPLNPGCPTHPNRVHESDFGPEWQYWSRSVPNWKPGGGVAAYLAYVHRLFETA